MDHRRAGVLLHPTSLPGPYYGGDLGQGAYDFINFLASAGCTVWQMLPLGPTHFDGSPYQSLSVLAGNPLLISLDELAAQGWLDLSTITEPKNDIAFRQAALKQAAAQFFKSADSQWLKRFDTFKQQSKHWLADYALFIGIKQEQDGHAWTDWPDQFKQRQGQALKLARQRLQVEISQVEFEQFMFFSHWQSLRDYAHQQGVYLFGDVPIFVSHDSADVWVHRDNFLLDEQGMANVVAGVPPDAFSAQGQRWGNPMFDWQYMQETDFKWWKQRIDSQAQMFDLLRIDHFRGFRACWQIPAEQENAIIGHWEKAPGQQLLASLFKEFSDLSLIAEDLGLITPGVIKLRNKFKIPGMKVLQFAFGDHNQNPYLPHNHQTDSVVYTGTHDNDTSLGWYQSLDGYSRQRFHEYLGMPSHESLDMPWVLNRLALSSVAQLAILPMQDLLSLDSNHRMNTPGTTENNWQWRFNWQMMWPSLAADLKHMLSIYGRLVEPEIEELIPFIQKRVTDYNQTI